MAYLVGMGVFVLLPHLLAQIPDLESVTCDLSILNEVKEKTQEAGAWTLEQLMALTAQWENKPKPDPEPEPEPDPKPLPWPFPNSTNTDPDDDDNSLVLYHYTDFAGYTGILSSGVIYPSLANDNTAAFGHGVYFTDLSPQDAFGTTKYKLSRALQNTPWKWSRVMYYIGVDISGLYVERVGNIFSFSTYGTKGIFLYPSKFPLEITNRLVTHGQTPVTD
jgi:hypothetical protein